MISENKKVFFIVNKYSGTGFKPEMENTCRHACHAQDTQCALEYTQAPGHATTLARDAIAEGFQHIIAVGGDGTVNEVAQAVIGSTASMGIIPKGSGNGLARHLHIPVRLEYALKCLFTSKQLAIDTVRINGKLSLNVSGIGFDGYIAERFGTDKQRGFKGYTKLVLNEFNSFQEFDATIGTGGSAISKKAFVIAIANSSQYGNNARIAPAASVCDGLLDLGIVRKFPMYRVDFIYSFFSGTIEQSAYYETIQVRNTTIKLNEAMSYHIDGEPGGKADQFTIELAPASLNMLAPCTGKF